MVPYKQFSSADIFDYVQKLLPTFIPEYEQYLNSSMFLIKMSNKLSKFCNYLNFAYSIAHNRIGHVITQMSLQSYFQYQIQYQIRPRFLQETQLL